MNPAEQRREYERVGALVKIAKALGIDPHKFEGTLDHDADMEGLEKAIETKRKLLGENSWEAKMREYAARRKRLAAARLAGASLGQLAYIIGVSPQTIKTTTSKEIPGGLRSMMADERTGRVAALTPTQVVAMISAVSDEEALTTPVVILAAKMKTTIVDKGDPELDENDPYLRDDTDTPSSRIGERQE